MKLFFTISLMAFSALSFANHYKTLEEYDASSEFRVHWPSVNFSNVNIPVRNVCVDGENLKTITSVTYCSKQAVVEVCTTSGHSEICRAVKKGETPVHKPNNRLVWGCVGYNTKNFETTRTYQAPVCLKWKEIHEGGKSNHWECVQYGIETKEYNLSYDVSVTKNTHNGQIEVANLNFTILQCK